MIQKVQFSFCVLSSITCDDGEEKDFFYFACLRKLENRKVREVYEAIYAEFFKLRQFQYTKVSITLIF